MRLYVRNSLLAALTTVLWLAPSAKADNLALTGPGDGVSAANIYVGPYQGTVNGVTAPIICDDFTHDSFIGETWTALGTNLGTGNLANTLYGQRDGVATAATEYDAAAYLANELLAPSLNPTTQTDLQFAIWYLFDQSQVTTYLDSFGSTYASLLSAASADATAAETAEANPNTALTAAQLANFIIYTPTGNYSCPGGCANTPPQEFIADAPVSAAEPSTLVLLLAGLGGLAIVAARRQKTGVSYA